MLPDLYANEEAGSEVRRPARLKGTSPSKAWAQNQKQIWETEDVYDNSGILPGF